MLTKCRAKKTFDALWCVNKSKRLIGGDKKGKINARNVDYKHKRALTCIKLPFRLSKQASKQSQI